MTLPNFIIIGVAKAGTTSLFHYLDQHPQVYICSEKGTNFFGYEDARAWKWADEGAAPALRHFQAKSFQEYEALFAGVSDEIAIGEVSPQYIRCPTAAQRIHECIPDVKLLVSLRNPADRAFSGFMMRTRRGEAVKSVYEELTSESSHVKEGFYYKRLKRYFDLFPRDRIKISLFEEFKRNPPKIIMELYEFLSVDTTFVPDTSVRHNPGAVPKIRWLNRLFYSPTFVTVGQSVVPSPLQGMLRRIRQLNLRAMPNFPPDLRADLLNLYREDILRLQELLDRDLSIWLI